MNPNSAAAAERGRKDRCFWTDSNKYWMEMKLWLRDFKDRCADSELVNSNLRIGNYSEKNKSCNHKKNLAQKKTRGLFQVVQKMFKPVRKWDFYSWTDRRHWNQRQTDSKTEWQNEDLVIYFLVPKNLCVRICELKFQEREKTHPDLRLTLIQRDP